MNSRIAEPGEQPGYRTGAPEIPLLDHGRVILLDHMGGDDRVVGSARVSTGKDPNYVAKPEADARLIAYLLTHGHGTPFEHAVFQFFVKAPIFVFREWQRHRIGCIAGDTLVTLYEPSGKATVRTIKHLHDATNGVTPEGREWYANGRNRQGEPARTRRRRLTRERYRVIDVERRLRVYDEAQGIVTAAPMAAIWETGVKPVYELQAGTRMLRATAEHRFLTPEGWKRLDELDQRDAIAYPAQVAANPRPIPPSLRAGIGAWTTMLRTRLIGPVDTCYICARPFAFADLVLDHVVPVAVDLRLALDEGNLRPACEPCHQTKTNGEQRFAQRGNRLGRRWARTEHLPRGVGMTMTYDLSVDGPHNYTANGLFVHNSFNEQSGRYSEFKPEFYVPSHVRRPHPTNKQGSVVVEGEALAVATTLASLQASMEGAFAQYDQALKGGVAREMARMILPVSTYSSMWWTVNARSLLNFLALRNHPDAQYEIAVYAQAIEAIVATIMPLTYDAFVASGRRAP